MVKFCVKKSNINGKGVFSCEAIPKGKRIFYLKGKVVQFREDTKEKAMMYPNWYGIGKDLWIDPSFPFMFVNHSCMPNMGMIGKVTFVALKNIKKGEELTLDYSISEDTLWDMECSCGASCCRKTIRGIRFLPHSFFKKYYPNIPRYFQKIYLRSRRTQN